LPARRIKLGIAGAGSAAELLHLPALLQLGETFEMVAIADADLSRAQRIAPRVPGVRVYSDPLQLIESPDVEAVAVVTPPATHCAIALAALRAGKHVFVEKPLAVTAEQAEVLVSEAASTGLCAAVGHNLRLHRLVRRAQAALHNGVLGELIAISATWSAPAGRRPEWQADREQGGGVLFDFGVHHVDLARLFSGSELDDVSASAISAGSDDVAAAVSARMRNGIVFSGCWSKAAAAYHAIRLTGTGAIVEFSPYRANSWRVLPDGVAGLRGYVFESREYISQLPDIFSALRKGGDSADSYRLQWLDFARAIETGGAPACSFDDGLRSVAACRAMLEAAATGRRVRIAQQQDTFPPEIPDSGPALSAILAIHGGFAAVRRTVRHLARQTVRDRIELLLVAASEEQPEIPRAEVAGFYSYKLVRVAPGSSVAVANAAGVRSASAAIVAFAEDHCFPEKEWAEALIDAHRRGFSAVGPQIVNANPGSVVSWCDYLIGYGPWMSPCSPGEAAFLPGHNSSYRRDELLAYGDRLESMLEAETVLHFDLARRGRKLYVEPRARAEHLNFALWGVWLPVQYHCGRVFAGSRAASWGFGRKILYGAASPLIPAVRLARICRELLKPGRPKRLMPRLLPALSIGLIADGFGQMAGYLGGVGLSAGRIAVYEYNRIRYIRPEDRLALEAETRGDS
jgi:predicted dehydrogenase